MPKRELLITASAFALVAAMATASVSQAPSSEGRGTSQEQQKDNPGSSDRGAGADEKGATEKPRGGKGGSAQRDTDPKPKASDRAEEKASPKSRVQGQGPTPKASERAQEKSSPKSAVQQKDADDKGRDSRAAGDREKDSSKQTDKGREKDTPRQSDKGGDKDTPRQSDKGQAKDRDRSAGDSAKDRQDDRKRGDRAEGERGDRSGGQVQLSEQKRTSVRERISKSGRANRVTNVNFDIRVGVNVPRSTTFHVLPPDVVEIVPEYRGYRYVYVRDEIIIVHPTSYVIVAVIGDDGRVGSRSGGRSITLASDDRVFIRRSVDMGARIRLGIGSISIGMNLPDTVELRPLPEIVVARHPDLRGHRYFVYEDDVVIVEPQTREVVLVIED